MSYSTLRNRRLGAAGRALRVGDRIWMPSVLGAVALWIALIALKHSLSLSTLLADAEEASFVALIALGQTIVIATGDYSIDLSMPYTMTVAAFLSVGLGGSAVWGILAAVAFGLVVGTLNTVLVAYLRLPAIIATLAVGYMLQSAIQVMAGSLTAQPHASVVAVADGRVAGIPVMVIIGVVVAVLVAVVTFRTKVGYELRAAGQNATAASLLGIPIKRLRWFAFLFSGAIAAITGVLLAGYSGGAFAALGDNYLLLPIGASAIGGTVMSGGRFSPGGVLGGSLMLILVVAVLELASLSQGVQDIVEGAILIGVVSLATTPKDAAS